MNVHDFDPTCHDDRDDFADERAYDLAAKRHAKADAAEMQATGGRLDPMPTFAEFIGGVDDEPYDEQDDSDDMRKAA